MGAQPLEPRSSPREENSYIYLAALATVVKFKVSGNFTHLKMVKVDCNGEWRSWVALGRGRSRAADSLRGAPPPQAVAPRVTPWLCGSIQVLL